MRSSVKDLEFIFPQFRSLSHHFVIQIKLLISSKVLGYLMDFFRALRRLKCARKNSEEILLISKEIKHELAAY